MPSRRVHNRFAQILLGSSFNEVNRVIDLPHRFLKEKHRVIGHDPLSAFLIGYALAGERGGLAGLLHIALDEIANDPKAKKIIEALL